MSMLNTIKKQIHIQSKNKKFISRNNEYDYNIPTVYINKQYYDCSGSLIPIKLASAKYKLQIYFDYNYVICIDAKKVLIFDDKNLPSGLSNRNKPFYESETISNEDFFNLSMQNIKLFSEQEIKELREFMSTGFKNTVIKVYFEDLVLSGLVPYRW